MKPGPAPSFGVLSRDGATLLRGAIAQTAAILAAGLLPGAAAAILAYASTGIDSQSALNAAIHENSRLAIATVLAAGLFQKALAALALLALVPALGERDAGRSLSTRQAYRLAWRRLPPLLRTLAQALWRVLAGLIPLLLPGLRLALRYSLAHLAVLLEGLEGRSALERSAALLERRLWRAIACLAAALLATMVLNAACALAAAAFIAPARSLLGGGGSAIQGQLEVLAVELPQGFAAAWLAAFSIRLYRDLARADPSQAAGRP
ncbi:MAG: hypothetical protein KGO96_12895 [Elusimicrobia bacterium]|nr:hypothetical protein [Elusimicrobiota bacterium]MDE2426792.1 hypothetical protein [Elusimicrobiota bacterium]